MRRIESHDAGRGTAGAQGLPEQMQPRGADVTRYEQSLLVHVVPHHHGLAARRGAYIKHVIVGLRTNDVGDQRRTFVLNCQAKFDLCGQLTEDAWCQRRHFGRKPSARRRHTMVRQPGDGVLVRCDRAHGHVGCLIVEPTPRERLVEAVTIQPPRHQPLRV